MTMNNLITVRDYIRYAVSRFNAADLTYGHGTAGAFDDAVYLVLESLHLPIDSLEPYLEARLTAAEQKLLAERIETRVTTRKPTAYIVNKAYLQGVPFYVDERVIVPRSYIAELLNSEMVGGDDFTLIDDPTAVETVLDLCTGSGCLAVVAAHIFSGAAVDAVELSPEAAEVAARNIKDSGHAERIELFKGDLFAPLKNKKYDLIITNPPYVDQEAMGELPPEYQQEPAMALFGGGADGLDIVRRILKEAPKHLTEGGALLCEIGRGREIIEAEFPQLEFLWLDTADSMGEVFWLTKEQF
jgi:ribosomal protein L3 glutamine methyltransferase